MQIYIQINGATKGPFSIEQVRQKLSVGEVTLTNQAFIDGQTSWIPLSQVPELQNTYSSQPNQTSQRKVGFLLGLGIFFLPFIFSWFTLRRGYSTLAKIIAFCWLGAMIVSIAVQPPQSKQVSSTSPDTKKSVASNNESVSSIIWSQIDAIYNLKSKTTDIRKEEAWKSFKGKRVVWSGEVSEISKGLFGGITLQVKMNEDTFTSDLIIKLKSSEKAEASSLSKGDRITFSGTLDNWGTILPITLEDGEIL